MPLHWLRATWLCFLGCCWLNATPVHADALRGVDRATGGGGGHHESSGGGSPSSGGRSSSRTSGSSGYYGRNWGYGGGGYYGPGECARYGNCGSDSFGMMALGYTLGAPWTLPYMFDGPKLTLYAPYPYYDGPGILRPERDDPETDEHALHDAALAVDLESGYQIEHVVPATLALRLLLPRRLEIDARSSLLSDVNENPTQIAAAGTAHVNYRFAQGPRWDFRTGVGPRVFTLDRIRWGFDIVYAFDAYLGRAFVLRGELHVGALEHAFVWQARGTLGAMFGPCELYAGYDHTTYAGPSRQDLSGPVGGLRVWF